jgi:hypothetical protein
MKGFILADKGMRTAIIREAALQDPKMKTGRWLLTLYIQ